MVKYLSIYFVDGEGKIIGCTGRLDFSDGTKQYIITCVPSSVKKLMIDWFYWQPGEGSVDYVAVKRRWWVAPREYPWKDCETFCLKRNADTDCFWHPILVNDNHEYFNLGIYRPDGTHPDMGYEGDEHVIEEEFNYSHCPDYIFDLPRKVRLG